MSDHSSPSQSTRGKRDRDGKGEAEESIKILTIKTADGPITPDLDAFIHPMPRTEFFEKVYTQKALAIKAHPKLRSTRLQVIGSLMDGFHPVKMLEQSNSAPTTVGGDGGGSGISVWMKKVGAEGTMQSIKVGASEAKTCYDAGHSLYFRGSEMLESSMLNEFATSVGFNFASRFRDGLRRSEIEVFAAHVGHKTPWHFDFQENFTVQLRGAKKWTILKANVKAPHRACAMHFQGGEANTKVLHNQHTIHRLDNPKFNGLPEGIEEEAETVVLQAGDVLYHPAGCWHKVETVACPEEANSLSINMSFFPQTWGDLVQESMQQLMLKGSHWRERVRFDDGEEGRAQLTAKLELLKKEVETVSAADILPDTLCRDFEGQSLRYITVDEKGKIKDSGDCTAWKDVNVDSNSGRAWKRNPLGVMSKTEDFFAPAVIVPLGMDDEPQQPEDSDDEEEESNTKTIEQPEGTIRFDYHANFAVEELLPGAPHVHLVIFANPKYQMAMLELCALPANGQSIPQLPRDASQDLQKALSYVGYLSMV